MSELAVSGVSGQIEQAKPTTPVAISGPGGTGRPNGPLTLATTFDGTVGGLKKLLEESGSDFFEKFMMNFALAAIWELQHFQERSHDRMKKMRREAEGH